MVLEEGEVLVPDDKQKKHMWLVPCLCTNGSCFILLVLQCLGKVPTSLWMLQMMSCVPELSPPSCFVEVFVLGPPTVQASGSLLVWDCEINVFWDWRAVVSKSWSQLFS